MQTQIAVVAYGSLAQKMNVPAAAGQPLAVPAAQPLIGVLDRLGLAAGDIQLIMVNHRAADPAQTVRPGDRVALFPKEYPIFVDWHAFRSP